MKFQSLRGKRDTQYFGYIAAHPRISFSLVQVVFAFLVVHNVQATSFDTRQLTNTSWDNGYPVISGDIVAWEDFRDAGPVESPGFGQAGISTYNLTTNTGGLTIPDARIGGFTVSSPLNHVNRSDLAISGDNIVWTKFPPFGGYDIYNFNLQTGVQDAIGTSAGFESSPDISGSRVVWQDPALNSFGGVGWDLYLYDLGTKVTSQLTMGGTSKYPSIDGSRVVWGDLRTGGFETHLLDVGTKIDQRIEFGLTPDISGNKIINTRLASGIEIFALDLGTGENFPLTALASGSRAFLSGDRVVYSDNRTGQWQIFLYDLLAKKEFPLTDGLFDARFPMIDGDRIVYMGDVSGHWQIFETDILSDAQSIFPIPDPGPIDTGPGGPVVASPEPNTWMLLGSGLLIMLWFRRFKKIGLRTKV